MEKKIFTVGRLILSDKQFQLSAFSSIAPKESKEIKEPKVAFQPQQITNRVIETECVANRFFCVYFEEGKILPNPDVVYNTQTGADEHNHRGHHIIERDAQTFVLIDQGTQKIFISDSRKKGFLKEYLEEKTNKNVIIKNIIDKDDFINEIEQLKTVHFSATPDIFSLSEGAILSEQLKQDIYNFGMDVKSLSLELEFVINNSYAEKAKNILLKLMRYAEDDKINKLEITGRTQEAFERVFNADGIFDKIEIKLSRDEHGMFDKSKVFDLIIEQIK